MQRIEELRTLQTLTGNPAVYRKVNEEVKTEVSRFGLYRFDGEQPAARDQDIELRAAFQRIALESPSYGLWRITVQLQRRGWMITRSAYTGSSYRLSVRPSRTRATRLPRPVIRP